MTIRLSSPLQQPCGMAEALSCLLLFKSCLIRLDELYGCLNTFSPQPKEYKGYRKGLAEYVSQAFEIHNIIGEW